jgi:site-specific DNA recombinase
MVRHLHPPEGDYERDCVSYLRKSKGRAGITRQRRDNELVAKLRGWRIIAEFVDTDATAFTKVGQKQAQRDDYQALLAMLRDDTRDKPLGVLAWHADRLHRSTDEVGVFIAICAKGGHPVETSRSGGYDLTTATGRKRLKQDALDAEAEVDHMVERIESQKSEAARLGRWGGGPVPFGWHLTRDDNDERVLALEPGQAAAVRWGSEQTVRGATLGTIARRWNADGHRRHGGGEWNESAVRDVLLRPRNAGLAVHRGQVVETELPGGKADWEPIVTEELWRAVVVTLTDERRRTSPGPKPRWWGSGLYLCGVCRSPLKVQGSGSRRYGRRPASYRCRMSGAKHVARQATHLDGFVEKTLLLRLARPDVAALLAEEEPPDIDGMKARLVVEQSELGEWRRLAKAGKVSAVAFAESEQAVLQRIEAIKQEMAAAVPSPVLAELLAAPDVFEYWESRRPDLEWRKAVLASVVTVIVHPAKRGRPAGWKVGMPYFDTDTIEFDWRRRPAAT